mgnify:CR=1 FL=1
MKVKVYKNITKDCLSVMDYKTRKVIRHCYGDHRKHGDHIRLENASFWVSQKTRDRVVREKKKYVHAFVIGDWIDNWTLKEQFEQVFYDPYKFLDSRTLELLRPLNLDECKFSAKIKNTNM